MEITGRTQHEEYNFITIFLMQSSVGSCSPENSNNSLEFMFPLLDYEDYAHFLTGDDPYAPGYAPDAPAPVYAPDIVYAPDPVDVFDPILDLDPVSATNYAFVSDLLTDPVMPLFPSSPLTFTDAVQASYGFYPIEMIEESDPLEFIVRYPYPWDPSPPEDWDEWMMVNTPCNFLDHITWFAGEWHLVWGNYCGPVYSLLD